MRWRLSIEVSSAAFHPVRRGQAEPRLGLALAVSLLLHGVLLLVHFTLPTPRRVVDERALDIVLVNSRSARPPSEAQVRAQANLDSGGNTDKERRAKTPLPPAARQQDGDELHQAQRKVQELEAQQQRLVARAPSKASSAPVAEREVQHEPLASVNGRDLAQSALAMARIEGEIARELDDYNRRPRKKFIGVRAEEYRFAQYIEDWRQKIERIGTLNYPAAARGKLYGSLVLSVTLRSDGSVANVEINRSSGHKILDDAARRIVAMAAPFAAFPPAIQDDTDVLVITRSWNFTQRDSLETKAR